jgi:hypothetical protein
MMASETASRPAAEWRSFAAAFCAAAALLTAILYGAVLALDPYGTRVRPGHPPGPLMDSNQRYMYPQVARGGGYDSAVFGTSTARLLDPERLAVAIGGRFANLAVNAATPWEQLQLAALFLRHAPDARTLVLGLDRSWCEPAADAPANLTTFRAFPAWLYDEGRLNDLPELLNLKSLEIAGRVALNRLGLARPRIRPDGFDVFTPPEALYDADKARANIRQAVAGLEGGRGRAPPPEAPLPAVAWLAEFAARLPAATRLAVLLPPLHALAQPEPGSPEAEADERCKARIGAALAGGNAVLLDYRRRTALTADDTNFWDPLHFRLPVAAAITEALGAALRGDAPPAGAPYGVLLPPRG